MRDKEAEAFQAAWDFSALREAAEILRQPKRVKAALKYAQTKSLYLQAGVEEVLNLSLASLRKGK